MTDRNIIGLEPGNDKPTLLIIFPNDNATRFVTNLISTTKCRQGHPFYLPVDNR
jgi:hypothetical protein